MRLKRFYQAYTSENKKRETFETPLHYSRRFNLSLAGCSSAEPVSVSVKQRKIQNYELYLQPVEKVSHVPHQILSDFRAGKHFARNSLFRVLHL